MDENRYPVGIQSFAKIRNSGKIYVDKTNLVHRLVSTSSYYFLSRPRRFGKSLLVSTLEEYFLGHKELFKGLAIESLQPDEWLEHPVFHFDMSKVKYSKTGELAESLNLMLKPLEEKYGRDEDEIYPKFKFIGLIDRAYKKTGRQVVVLIDEYDIPIINSLDKPELEKHNRTELKDFYGVMKSMDAKLRFVLLTGVGKLGHLSVFSDLNNLNDISMDRRYLALCGVTDEELRQEFAPSIRLLAQAQNMTYEETCQRLQKDYDGYHFTHNSIGIYNPFSLLNTFDKQEFGSYWFETGTPTYLVELLKRNHYNLEEMAHAETYADVLNSIYGDEDPLPVIFQSGYLTIKEYDPRFGLYRLGFPNREVEEGFVKFLMPFYTRFNKIEAPFEIQKFVREIESGQPDAFFRRLQSFFADTPYELVGDRELHYQNVLFIVFKLVGFYTQVEYHTSEGRVDLVLKTDRYIYIMEFKFEGTAEEALRQIDEKHYAQPFEADGRPLFRIGVNFSARTRNIERWLIKA